MTKRKKKKIGRRNDNYIYEIKLSSPSQFAGQLITICQAVHLIMSQLNQKQMILQPTNATIVKATLTSSNYLCNILYLEEVQVALYQKKPTKNKLFSFANRNASDPAVFLNN